MNTEEMLPTCAQCGMRPVQLTMAVVPTDPDAEIDLGYFCNWECVQMFATNEVAKMPKHGNARRHLDGSHNKKVGHA